MKVRLALFNDVFLFFDRYLVEIALQGLIIDGLSVFDFGAIEYLPLNVITTS